VYDKAVCMYKFIEVLQQVHLLQVS
jgi:hypothetical protein